MTSPVLRRELNSVTGGTGYFGRCDSLAKLKEIELDHRMQNESPDEPVMPWLIVFHITLE